MPLKNDLQFRNSEIENITGTETKLKNVNNFKNKNFKTAILDQNCKGKICCIGVQEQDLLIKGLSLLNLMNLVEFDKRDSSNIKQLCDDDKFSNTNISMVDNFDSNVQENFKIDNKEVSGQGDSTKLVKKHSSSEQSSLSKYQVFYLQTIYDNDSEQELHVTDIENFYSPGQMSKYINNKKECQLSQYSSSDNTCITSQLSDNVNYSQYDSNERNYENSTTLSEETEIESDNLMSDDTECRTKSDENVCTLREFCQQFKLLYVPKKLIKPKCDTQSNNKEENCVFEGGLGSHLRNFKDNLKFPPIPEHPPTVSCQLSPILCAALSNQSIRKRESVFSKFIRRCRGQKQKKTKIVRKLVSNKQKNIIKSKGTTPIPYPNNNDNGVDKETKAGSSNFVHIGMRVEPPTSQSTKASGCAHTSTLTTKCIHNEFARKPRMKLSNSHSMSSISCECEQSAGIGTPLCIRDALKAAKKKPNYLAQWPKSRVHTECKKEFENYNKHSPTRRCTQSNNKISNKEQTKDKGTTCVSVTKSKTMISQKNSCTEPVIKTLCAQNSCSILLPPKTNQKEPPNGKIKKTDSCGKCKNANKSSTQDIGITCQQREEKKQLVSKYVDSLPQNVKCSVQVSCSDLEVKPIPSICKCQLTTKPSVYEKGVTCHSIEDKKNPTKKLSSTDTLGRRSSSQTLYSSILAVIRGKEAGATKPKVPYKYKTAKKSEKDECCQSVEDQKICISQKISCTQPYIKQYSVQVSCTNLLECLRPKKSACVGPDQSLDMIMSNKSCGATVVYDLLSPQQTINKQSIQISCSSLIPSIKPKNYTCVATNTITEPFNIPKQCVQNLTSGDDTTNDANCKDCSELSNSINKFFQLLGSIIGKEDDQQDPYPDLQAIRNPNFKRFDNLTYNSSKTSTDCSNNGILEKFHSKLINNLIHQLYNDNEYEKLDSRIKNLDRALQNTIIEPYLSYLKNQNEENENQAKKQRNQHCKEKDKKLKKDSPNLQMQTSNYQKQLPIKGREKLCLCQIQSMEISNGLRKRNIIKVCDISKVNNKKLKDEDVLKESDHNYYYNSFLPIKLDNTKKLPITYYDFIQKPSKCKRSRKKKTAELGESIDRSACSPVCNLSNHLIHSSSCSVVKEERELACTSTLEASSLFGPKPPEIVKLRSKPRKT